MSVLSQLMDANTPVTITMAVFPALVIADMVYCQMAKVVLVSVKTDTYVCLHTCINTRSCIQYLFICYEALCTLGCSNGGNCTLPEMCTCPSQWTGIDCTEGTKF